MPPMRAVWRHVWSKFVRRELALLEEAV